MAAAAHVQPAVGGNLARSVHRVGAGQHAAVDVPGGGQTHVAHIQPTGSGGMLRVRQSLHVRVVLEDTKRVYDRVFVVFVG